jgi:hypothetical protein
MEVGSDRVLDAVMLENLAVIAAANDRTLIEEINRAVELYVLNEFAQHGERELYERAFMSRAQAK